MSLRKSLVRGLAQVLARVNLDSTASSFLESWIYRNYPPSSAMRKAWRTRRFQILTYHKVSPEKHPFFPPVDPAIFDKQMAFLKETHHVLHLDELMKRSERGEIPERAVAISFDDGYEDNFTWAFPVLRKYGLPATIFLATAAIDNRAVLWHDRIFDAFRFAQVKSVVLDGLGSMSLCLNDSTAMERSLQCVIAQAKKLPAASRLELLDEIEEKLGPDIKLGGRVRMLSWDQIREMVRSGLVRIGSHTVTHPILSRVEKPQLLRELAESKLEIESQVGVLVEGFAYPNGQTGDYNDQVKTQLSKVGYRYAVTTTLGFNTTWQDPFELLRGQPWQQDIELFRLNFFLQRHVRH